MMKYTTLAAVSLLALTACSNNTVKDTLGLERAPPDEFRVVSRPPLSIPPQFTLRPPSDSDISPNQLPADKTAQALINGTAVPVDANGSVKSDTAVTPVTITGTPASTKAGAGRHSTVSKASASAGTGAESQFLKDAGADKADPQVRNLLTEEKYSLQEKKDDKSWYDVFSTDAEQDPIVDARKEAQRIQANTDAGKSVTDGKTPEIKPADKGIFSGVLGN